jgi:lysozyme
VWVLSPTGVGLIKSFESCKLTAYPDQKGVPTIGWGHTAGVKLGDTCSQAQADSWFLDDTHWASLEVIRTIDVAITQNQFDAVVSLVFNIGSGNWASSTLRRLINGHSPEASQEFLKWDHVNGAPDAGLLRRRKAEQALFLTV